MSKRMWKHVRTTLVVYVFLQSVLGCTHAVPPPQAVPAQHVPELHSAEGAEPWLAFEASDGGPPLVKVNPNRVVYAPKPVDHWTVTLHEDGTVTSNDDEHQEQNSDATP